MAATVMEGIASRCVAECIRQGVGVDAVGRLLLAYDYALEHADRLPSETDLRALARLVEPARNEGFRRVAVTFRQGGAAADWREVPDAVHRLFATLDRDAAPDDVVRAFLRVHPFADGNGRVAFVLYNWLHRSLASPMALPDFSW